MSSSGEPEKDKRPNLTLIYALMALAFLAAAGVAALIILPFYHRR